MNCVEKNEAFIHLLNDLGNEHKNTKTEYKYIGTGNPNSKVLFIGKEAAISTESDQYKKEILENYEFWFNLKDFNIEEIKEKEFETYSPLYPYRGQILNRDNGQNWGTSPTWMNYQKLINKIYNTPQNKNINFHEKSFITEVNSTPSKKTVNANIESISFRKKHILTSNFIRNFPITIISGVGYFETIQGRNEIEKIFNVDFIAKKYGDVISEKQPYWIHWNKSKTKLLINTFQLSMGISDLLLDAVAEEIRSSNLL